MTEHKRFLVDLAETIDRHLPRKKAQSGAMNTGAGRMLRWLIQGV